MKLWRAIWVKTISWDYKRKLLKTATRYLAQYGDRANNKGVKLFLKNYSFRSLLKRYYEKKTYGFAPGVYVVSITNKCNLHCKYCYPNYGENGGVNIDLDKLDIIIREMIRHFGVHLITITGGETFPYVLKVAERNPDVIFFTYTNGYFLNNDACEKIKLLGNIIPCLTIVGSEKTHDSIRGMGSYQAVLKAIENLKRHSLFWGFSLTASQTNYQEIITGDLFDKLLKFEPFYIRLIPYMPVGREQTNLVLSKEERKKLSALIKDYNNKEKIIIHDYINNETTGISCMAGGKRSFYINENLELSPCVFMDTFVKIDFDLKKGKSNLIDLLKNHYVFSNGRKLSEKYPSCIILDNPEWRKDIITQN